jgi:tol-pal system protein YbgF
VETPLSGETIDAPETSVAPEKRAVVSRGAVLPQPGTLYSRGYVLYHQGEYARAEEALGSFLLAQPDSPHADNARYWIGECRYARGLYHESIEAFREVIDRHPGGGKASHALYKIALSFERLGETGGMQRTLQDLLERFPESDVAPLARSRLGGV